MSSRNATWVIAGQYHVSGRYCRWLVIVSIESQDFSIAITVFAQLCAPLGSLALSSTWPQLLIAHFQLKTYVSTLCSARLTSWFRSRLNLALGELNALGSALGSRPGSARLSSLASSRLSSAQLSGLVQAQLGSALYPRPGSVRLSSLPRPGSVRLRLSSWLSSQSSSLLSSSPPPALGYVLCSSHFLIFSYLSARLSSLLGWALCPSSRPGPARVCGKWLSGRAGRRLPRARRLSRGTAGRDLRPLVTLSG